MPILDDIMDHDVIGPAIRQGMAKGRQEGQIVLIRSFIAKRFGKVPGWVEDRLTKLSSAELEVLSNRLFDGENLGELFHE